MRVYGRITNQDGTRSWVVVQTDANGTNEQVYLTALAQGLKLNLNESPFYANVGIPAVNAVQTQVYPDFYVALMQQYYAGFFGSLAIVRVQGSLEPVYNIRAVTQSGAIISNPVAT